MLNPTPEEIEKAIKEINSIHLHSLLDSILERLYFDGRYIIIRELEHSTWKIECIKL